jgi:hypothetical protein
MRVSRRNKGLLYARIASLALSLWGLDSVQTQAGASAGPSHVPGVHANCIQVYLRAGLKTCGPGLHDYPQFIAAWNPFLTEHGAVLIDGRRRQLPSENLLLSR